MHMLDKSDTFKNSFFLNSIILEFLEHLRKIQLARKFKSCSLSKDWSRVSTLQIVSHALLTYFIMVNASMPEQQT